MVSIVFLLAVLLFFLGVLTGSVLHTRALDRRYRQLTQRVRELRELEEALIGGQETFAGISHRRDQPGA
ncbi:MAG TPA: hypothetical protein VFO16_06270 [Pseudonocardiaceae bacterium]|nr:hypothetical protein [Pseudonocardiaceae bacterium]